MTESTQPGYRVLENATGPLVYVAAKSLESLGWKWSACVGKLKEHGGKMSGGGYSCDWKYIEWTKSLHATQPLLVVSPDALQAHGFQNQSGEDALESKIYVEKRQRVLFAMNGRGRVCVHQTSTQRNDNLDEQRV